MHRGGVTAFFALLACSNGRGSVPAEESGRTHPPGYTNPIPAENALPGDPLWTVKNGDGAPSGGAAVRRPLHVEAYADRVSARAGDTIEVMAHIPAASGGPMGVHWTLYRLGWYGGAGARKLLEGSATAGPQPPCPPDPATGFVQCRWSPAFSVQIPADAVSGLFLVRILRDERWPFGAYVPLVVKDGRPSDLYFQASVTTYQAYNHWMGESLYEDQLGLRSRFAVKVGFDRPYLTDYGSGQVLRWEAHAASFLERSGYDVSYTTNLDVAREGAESIRRHGAFLSVGHDEYWDGRERDAVEAARDAGTHLFFLGGNAAYWKVRLEDPGPDGNARAMTCYKMRPKEDPLGSDPDLRTGRWRDALIGRPEEQLIGTMYEEQVLFGHSWIVRNSSSFVYEGTGLRDGDWIPGLVGYEYDRRYGSDVPGDVTVVAQSPLVDIYGRPGISEAVYYRAPSGALVFGSGSIYFSLGLDDFAKGPYRGRRDPRIERVLANLFKAALKLPVPATVSGPLTPLSAQPAGRWVASVGTFASDLAGPDGRGGPSSVTQLPDGSLVYADPRHHQVGRVGQSSPYAGTGDPGSDRQPVPASAAHFANPASVWADRFGNVFVADTLNSCIRKIGTDPDRTVSTFAGSCRGGYGFQDGAGTAARFSYPIGLSFSQKWGLLVADEQNHVLRAIDLDTANVTTLGDPNGDKDTEGLPVGRVLFPYVTAVSAADDGRIFIVSSAPGVLDMKIRVIRNDAARTVVTLAGGIVDGYKDGSGAVSLLRAQGGALWDGTGLLFSDPGGHRLRRLTPGTDAASSTVETVAGSGAADVVDGTGATAGFGVPLGLWRAKDGTVYLADGGGAIRVIRP
jgi:hypothetical protein